MVPWAGGDVQSASPELTCRAGEVPREIIAKFCQEKWLDPMSCPQIIAEQVRRRFGFAELELPAPHSFSMPVTTLEPLCLVDWVEIGNDRLQIYHDFYSFLPEVAERFCTDHHMPNGECTQTVLKMLQTQRSAVALAANVDDGGGAEQGLSHSSGISCSTPFHALPPSPQHPRWPRVSSGGESATFGSGGKEKHPCHPTATAATVAKGVRHPC